MARAVADIQKDIRLLSPNDQEELLFQLMEEFDLVPPELESLQMGEELTDRDRRLVRIETMIEIAQANRQSRE